ncbi:hypothetical protein GWI33_016484 [Rhynchophorus ferrugineus]|uniref:Peptidase S1 domain-containing protein n=1 Tax=Rhynchophorus ferrugineus TaxID=354439 RepID=A0A834I1I3_RHYFE|nr:hypothetical protein GWI33_016484 [Rhynchophorus ferrugineus]
MTLFPFIIDRVILLTVRCLRDAKGTERIKDEQPSSNWVSGKRREREQWRGWGMINESTYEPSDILQKVQITVFSDAYCLQTIGEDYSVGQNLCAGNINNTKGHCSGDSGGPLVINGIQWGIISWSIKPCISAPGVYTSLTNPSYRKWISSVAGV